MNVADILNKIVVTEVEDIITFDSPKGRQKRIENRKNYGLSFCTEGQITYTHKGREYVSDPSCAIILPQGASYTLRGDKKGVFPVINFTCAESVGEDMLILPIENVESYMKEYEQMRALRLFDKNRAKIIGLFYLILHRLCSEKTSSENRLLPAVRYLEKNYSSPELKNITLAQQCGMSEVHFRTLFVAQYGITPRQYVIDIRMDKAKQLLCDGILKIGEIAERCGFSNQYHFTRAFRQKTGLTPSEYMKQNKIYKI